MEEKLQMPSDQLKITIGSYDYVIKFPNNGQLIDIESYKVRLTNGASKELLFGDLASQEAHVMLCAIATFEVLIPEIFRNMNVKSLLELNPLQSKSLSAAYKKYYGWMADWRDFINKSVEEEPEKSE